ncbi:MAG: cell division protein FtsZ [Bacteroidales bacterium]|nr:cell division protein FtsZ [Bacteroidales bacterium]
MTDRIDFTPDYGARENSSIIKVIGVGGGGSNAVKHMYSEGIVGVDFLVCNTDQGHLKNNPVPEKLLLGSGLGAGANPDIARQFATESKDKIREFIGQETKMLFITAGMGKGTGTGASPVIAEVAQEMGILTIGVVTYPFRFEGKHRQKLADKGIEELSNFVDSLIVVKNQNILTYYKDQSMLKAYSYADDVLKNAVKCIAELITVEYNQNVDFNDVQTVMKSSGKAMLGLATASGEDRVERVVDDALNCPLLDTTCITNARNFLFFISYGTEANFSTTELEQLTDRFYDLQSDDAHIIWGQGVDESLGDAIKLSIIITNFNNEENASKDTHSIVMENDKAKEEDIFNTTLKASTTILDDGPTSTEEKKDSVNDLESLTAPAEQSNPNTGIIQEPVISQPFTIERQPVVGKLESQEDPFESEEDFNTKVSIPTILRMDKIKSSSAKPSVTETMNYHPSYEVVNDMSEFFRDLAD